MDISFLLARADGFDSPPVKSTILKSYLNEVADIKCRPLFVIVDTLSLVLDDSDPEIQRFLRLQPKALEACDAFPDRSPKSIASVCRSVTSSIRRRKSAVEKLDILEKLLARSFPVHRIGYSQSLLQRHLRLKGNSCSAGRVSFGCGTEEPPREALEEVPLVQQAVVKNPEQKGKCWASSPISRRTSITWSWSTLRKPNDGWFAWRHAQRDRGGRLYRTGYKRLERETSY